MTTARQVQRVIKAQAAFLEAAKVFDALPAKIRNEIGELIEAHNDGDKPPGGVIADAFAKWLVGDRA